MTITQKRMKIREHMENQEKRFRELVLEEERRRELGLEEEDSELEFHNTRIEDERHLVVLDIAESMSAEEVARIKAIPVWRDDWREVKDIKIKYSLSWNEMKWIQHLDF